MKRNLSRPIALILSGTCLAPAAAAEDELQTLSSETYELGIGYVSDDAYRFGRYNGLQDKGPYTVGGITARGYRAMTVPTGGRAAPTSVWIRVTCAWTAAGRGARSISSNTMNCPTTTAIPR